MLDPAIETPGQSLRRIASAAGAEAALQPTHSKRLRRDTILRAAFGGIGPLIAGSAEPLRESIIRLTALRAAVLETGLALGVRQASASMICG